MVTLKFTTASLHNSSGFVNTIFNTILDLFVKVLFVVENFALKQQPSCMTKLVFPYFESTDNPSVC